MNTYPLPVTLAECKTLSTIAGWWLTQTKETNPLTCSIRDKAQMAYTTRYPQYHTLDTGLIVDVLRLTETESEEIFQMMWSLIQAKMVDKTTAGVLGLFQQKLYVFKLIVNEVENGGQA